MSLGCFKSECSFLGKRTNKPVTLRPVEHTVLNLHLTSLTIKKSIVNWKDNANDGQPLYLLVTILIMLALQHQTRTNQHNPLKTNIEICECLATAARDHCHINPIFSPKLHHYQWNVTSGRSDTFFKIKVIRNSILKRRETWKGQSSALCPTAQLCFSARTSPH